MKLLVIISFSFLLVACASVPDARQSLLVEESLSRLPDGTRQLSNGALLTPSGRQYFVIPPDGRLVGSPSWPLTDEHGFPSVDRRRNGEPITAY